MRGEDQAITEAHGTADLSSHLVPRYQAHNPSPVDGSHSGLWIA